MEAFEIITPAVSEGLPSQPWDPSSIFWPKDAERHLSDTLGRWFETFWLYFDGLKHILVILRADVFENVFRDTVQA